MTDTQIRVSKAIVPIALLMSSVFTSFAMGQPQLIEYSNANRTATAIATMSIDEAGIREDYRDASSQDSAEFGVFDEVATATVRESLRIDFNTDFEVSGLASASQYSDLADDRITMRGSAFGNIVDFGSVLPFYSASSGASVTFTVNQHVWFNLDAALQWDGYEGTGNIELVGPFGEIATGCVGILCENADEGVPAQFSSIAAGTLEPDTTYTLTVDVSAVGHYSVGQESQFNIDLEVSPVHLGLMTDVDQNRIVDIADIDALTRRVAIGSDDDDNFDFAFDIDLDGHVTHADIDAWLDIANTWVGDANLDGEFNSRDLVALFITNKFETGESATWSEGDWNANGLFESGDFIEAFQAGGYEAGPRPIEANAVPEPATILPMLFAATAGIAAQRRRSLRRSSRNVANGRNFQ